MSTDPTAALDRVPLAFLPTPMQPLDRLTEALGTSGPRVWIKRDDQTGLATGGNKARKLEFLLAQARAQGADTLITAGSVQSNHARQTAAAARACGLAPELVLAAESQDPDYLRSGNLLLDDVLGATVHLVDFAVEAPERAMARIAAGVAERGGTPYVVPVGGSSPLGSAGYAACAAELLAGPVTPDLIVLASGSGGTQAGLVAGLIATGHSPRIGVLGMSVSWAAKPLTEVLHDLANRTLALLGGGEVPRETIQVDDRFIGPGYGIPTPEMVEAVELTARTEGILLDPVYTGKAMAGLIAGLREGRFDAVENVVFLHTGGSAGLFAYRTTFQREDA